MVFAVSGLGLTVLDQVLFVGEYPTLDTKTFASDHMLQVGGPVPTALAQLRVLGVEVRLLATWADDLYGHAIESQLSATGIDFDGASCRTAGMSGFAHVWIESTTGRRTVVSMVPDAQPVAQHAVAFAQAVSVLHLDGWGGDAAVAAAEATRANGGLVTLDAGSVKPATERLLPLVTWLNAPKRFVASFCGTGDLERGAKHLLAEGPKLVTVTDGENGAGVFTSTSGEWRPAFPIQAIDSCCAGDVFCGGLIFALLVGLEPVAALEFAMAAAAIKVSRRGNRELATYEEVMAFLQATPDHRQR